MSTIATLRVPASTFVLDDTLGYHPSVEARLLRSVQVDGASMAPSMWLRSDDTVPLEQLLRSDPSVSDHSILLSSDDGGVYRIGIRPQSDTFLRLFVESSVTVVDSYAHDGEWVFRVLADNRDSLGQLMENWNQANLGYAVERISNCEDVSDPARFGLTESQYRALVTAFREGYYSVPRESDITTVANILGISHQATSQRLRRGHERLIQNALIERPAPGFPI
ncbi:helix-turn-helix domain-containing protein (plasmid) [Haloferax sp. S1W]|uniref:helix-turn-helix domain-containing protein n=1 Tax=Haloferax sp. S1W TaxID=3377110 RepID=UPI0037CAA200